LLCCSGEGGAFCASWDLKYGASLQGHNRPLHDLDFRTAVPPRVVLGPTRLELDKPVHCGRCQTRLRGGMELAL
jgi:enoyl-CoA hydratase